MSLFARGALLLLSLSLALPAQAALWRDLAAAERDALGTAQIQTLRSRVLRMDLPALSQQLSAAPMEFTAAMPLHISLPLPDGSSAEFRVQETQVMHPALAAKYPQIKTYVGQGVRDPSATLRLQTGPKGLRAMILSPSGTVYMDPYRQGDAQHALVYYKRDALRREAQRRYAPLINGDQLLGEAVTAAAAPRAKASGTELRTYRLVMATTGEYFQFHNPPLVPLAGDPLADKAPVLDELVNLTNRVSGIYEREVAVRLELQPQTESVMFTSAVADPYADNDPVGVIAPTTMVATNTLVLDALAGSANYDIGHVASTGGGGVAGLGVVCSSNGVPFGKGAGVTGLPEPVGDAYYVDYVAHEMGHQFGGNHTFNSATGSCSGNGNPGTAYEPGSGVTIQGYAGICGTDDLAPHSIDVFHGVSYDEIVSFTTTGGGNSCAKITPTANHPPVVDAGPSHTIPKQTPFALTGSATDADGDALTYQWEEFDLGPAGPVNVENGDAPIFRSFLPTESPTRVFPRIEALIANDVEIGEILPATERLMQFRLNVRDNAVLSGAGGQDFAFTDVRIAAAGPFRLTAPNGNETLAPGADLNVTWDVAGTDAPPVSCAAVDIDLSSDGGYTYPSALAAAVPNTGGATVKLPADVAAQARLRIKCSDNIFFDISDADFSIGAAAQARAGRFGGALPLSLLVAGLLLVGLRRR